MKIPEGTAFYADVEQTDGKINELLLEDIPALIESGRWYDAAVKAQKLVELLDRRGRLDDEMYGRHE